MHAGGRPDFRRNRNGHPILTMHTVSGNKLYGFEYEPMTLSNGGVYGNRHIKLLLGRIFVYNMNEQMWYDIRVETPFPDNKLLVLNASFFKVASKSIKKF